MTTGAWQFPAWLEDAREWQRRVADGITQLAQGHSLPLRYSIVSQPASVLALVSTTTAPARGATDDGLLFDATATESVVTSFVLPYDYAENEAITPVIRWDKSTSATGEAAWGERHRWVSVEATLPAWSSTATGSARQAQPVALNVLTENVFPAISGTGMSSGSLLQIEISRIVAGAGDTYEADARLRAIDLITPTNARGYDATFTKYLLGS